MKNRSSRLAALLALVASLGLGGCTDWALSDLDWAYNYVPWFSTLRDDVSFDPYESPRLPAAYTVPAISPNGEAPPLFAQSALDSVGAVLQNPTAATPAVVERGELVYNRHCISCHGPLGAGNGPVVGKNKFPFAPAINGPETAARPDGYIYGVVRVGRGLMPSYGARMSEPERWAVVHYVRKLQGSEGTVSVPLNPAAASAPQNVPDVLPSAPPAEEAREADAGSTEPVPSEPSQ